MSKGSKKDVKAIDIHNILSIIPFVWFVLFLTILAIGTFKLGYIPKYGNRVDPTALHLNFLIIIHAIFLILGILATIGWVGLTLLLYGFSYRNFKFNKTTLRLFTIGVSGFFVFKYIFSGAFSWVLD